MLQFGVGDLVISSGGDTYTIGRLNNVTINITYDSAVLRGGRRIFPDAAALYNGNIEGTFEAGEIYISGIGAMLAADQANTSVTLSSISVLPTGLDIKFSGQTNAETATITMYNCFFPGLTLNLDRENYTLPSTNFVVAGETSASGGRVIKIDNT